MPVLLTQGTTILAKSKDRETINRYLHKRYPNAKIKMLRDPKDHYLLRVYVHTPQVMRQLELYHIPNWRVDRTKVLPDEIKAD